MENIIYFNLADGQSANVRLLHSSVGTIECGRIHYTQIGDRKRNIRCPGNGCPICEKGEQPTNRVYIHLFDYTDNKEKVWSRTDKILPQLKDIEESWGNLNDCVVKITRIGEKFPKYEVTVLNPKNFEPIDEKHIDEAVAYRMYLTRSVDELKEYYETGVLPPHKKKEQAVSKEEYFNNKPKFEVKDPVPAATATVDTSDIIDDEDLPF